jgi:uncharacterized protein (TIGR02246 family)
MIKPIAAAAVLFAAAFASRVMADDVKTVAPMIDAADADWIEAMKAKDAVRLAAPYGPDALFVLADGRTLNGHDAILEFMRKRCARIGQVKGGGIYRDGLVEGADGLLYEWGHGGAEVVDVDGKTATTSGPYFTVWKRRADGSWSILRNLVF